MERPALRALADADEVELITTGRVTGHPHSVRLAFAYDDGIVWLRTDERPAAPDAAGVRRRSRRERDPDWLQNLAADPRATVRAGEASFPVRYEPPVDAERELRHVVDLMRSKYGADWVEDWYIDRGRVPVKLRLDEPAAPAR
jgi:hypothetical protein